MSSVDALLRRERAIVAAALAAVAVLAWIYVWRGAGTGMSALHMTAVTLFPHLHPDMAGAMQSPWLLVVSMWWVMMVAMMTPSAAPLVLLYGRVMRHHTGSAEPAFVPSLCLFAGYLVAWLVFSLAAAALQRELQPAGIISPMMLWSRSALLSAGVLAAAGLYQLSPLKQACLRQCRGPVQFLTQHWRPGRLGAFVLGLRHGAYCVGCCWMLMALLFVGGVMNLAWIGVLTLLVLVEKLAAAGEWVGRSSGLLLIAWALATLLA